MTVFLRLLSLIILATATFGAQPLLANQSNRSALPLLTGPMKKFQLHMTSENVPDSFLNGPGGQQMILSDFQGSVVLLNFWATWCAPCREEMPGLNTLQKSLGGRNFEVVAVSLDRAGEPKAKAWLDDHGITSLRVYTDPSGKIGRDFKIPGMPTTILIDKEGNEVGRYMGATNWHSFEAMELINHFIYR